MLGGFELNLAAMSLLSFAPQSPAIARVFRANLENEEFKPLFLNALASVDPVPYLDALAVTVERQIVSDLRQQLSHRRDAARAGERQDLSVE